MPGEIERPPLNSGPKRTKSTKKKRSASAAAVHPDRISPLKRQLEETRTWTKDEMGSFLALKTARERVELVYSLLPFDATGLDRLWPIQIVQKDSRIRRKLCERGKELFMEGEWEQALHHYNEACLFSSEKGLGHTLARRAAFLLQVDEVDLAIRDIKIAFELGCLGSELLDFLLAHHVTDDKEEEEAGAAVLEKSVDALYNPDVPGSQKKLFVSKLKEDLESIKRSRNKKRVPSQESVALIEQQVRNLVNMQHSESNGNGEDDARGEELALLDEDERHFIYPSLSSCVDVVVDESEARAGRRIVAQMELDVGEVVAIEEPNTILFCPNSKLLPLLKNHCVHCLSHSIAPLPCEDCCAVSYCSVRCKEAATSTYHKYECRMKLYEMLHFMGDEYMDIFTAIRTITQRPVSYFLKKKDRIWELLEDDHPEEKVDHDVLEPDSIEAVLRLMSHQDNVDEEQLMKNAVIAVLFLRALQAVHYFDGVATKRGTYDKHLSEAEHLILAILFKLINVQSHNSQPFQRLIDAQPFEGTTFKEEVGLVDPFKWARMGSAIYPTLALVNHSCDSNCIRVFIDKKAALITTRVVTAGEELTESYREARAKGFNMYHFHCECRACAGDWCVFEEMSDVLHLVPNFDSERAFKVRTGDKKDLVVEINRRRKDLQGRMIMTITRPLCRRRNEEMCFRAGEVELALLALTHLSSMLEQHIEKPHQYHIQANLSAKLCIMSKFLQKAIWEARAFDFEKRRFPPTLLNGELVTFEMPKFEGMPDWMRRADEPPDPKTKNRRSAKGKKKADKSASASADAEAGKARAPEASENATIIDSASNGTTSETLERCANEAKSAEGETYPHKEANLSPEKEENTCAPPFVPAQEKEVVGENFKRQAVAAAATSSSLRDSAAAATDDGDFMRGENGENWPLTVTDSDAADATNEATQKERSATAAQEEEEEEEEGTEGHGRGHIADEREEEGQEHDKHGGGGGSGGLESVSVSFSAAADDDVGQVKRLMEPESITASQAALATPERRELSRETIKTENEDALAPLTKPLLEGDRASVRRDATLLSRASVQKYELQSGEEGQDEHVSKGKGQKEGRKEKAVPQGVTAGRSNKKEAQISEEFECDDPSCEVCEWLDRHLKTTRLDEGSMATVVEELSRTIEFEEEGGKESDEALKAEEGDLERYEGRVDVRADAAAASAASVVSSSIAHKDVPQNKVDGGGGGLVHDASGRMPEGAGGGGGEGVANEPSSAGEARAGTTRRRESEFANALERDISRREAGGSDGGGAHRGQECEREREGDSGDGREKKKKKSIASDKKEVGDNCAEETAEAAEEEEAEEGKRSESNRNGGDAPFREDGRGGKGGEMRRGGVKKEGRAVQIVVEEAATQDVAGAKLLSQASALLSVSMPEIGNRNRLSAEASVSRNRDQAGKTKSRGRPPPPKMRITLPQSVDQHLLEQCERETNMSRLSSSMGRM